jgi:hypothetical protein
MTRKDGLDMSNERFSPDAAVDPYEEAALILSAAKQMFEDHSLAITGNKWDFTAAGEGVRTIWIIKAMRGSAAGPHTKQPFTQCEKCWQPATCKKYGCREPAAAELRIITTNFKDVSCAQKDDCAWPECECPRKATSGSAAMREALTYDERVEMLRLADDIAGGEISEFDQAQSEILTTALRLAADARVSS